MQLVIERIVGRNGHRINYRHITWLLVQKPGAFARYRYRKDLFPSLVFRRTYDAITLDGAGDAVVQHASRGHGRERGELRADRVCESARARA